MENAIWVLVLGNSPDGGRVSGGKDMWNRRIVILSVMSKSEVVTVTYFLSSDIAVYVLKRDVKLQPTNIHVRPWIRVIYQCMCSAQALTHCWLRISELEMITTVILWSSLDGLRRCWFFLRYRRYINHLLAYLLTFVWHVKCQCTALL